MADTIKNVKHKTWAEINLTALKRNYAAVKALVGDSCRVMCVVKADAYGHGAERCATALYEAGARDFAVSSIEEALALRSAFEPRLMYDARILVLGYTPPENADILAKYAIRQTVFSTEYAKALSHAAEKRSCAVLVHFKVDTGMNRLGFDAKNGAVAKILEAASYTGIVPEGIFSHFACSDEPENPMNAEQLMLFLKIDKALRERGLVLTSHISNSAAIATIPEAHLDMVRAGIILYGLEPFYPFDEEDVLGLTPVMTLKSVISHIHTVRAGEFISYGATYSPKHDITVATIPIGYADGYIRAFQNGGGVYIGDSFAPIVGRVCMDQCMVDITGIPGVSLGDEVVIFGTDKEQMRKLAEIADTINYELVCLIGKRVPRIYTE